MDVRSFLRCDTINWQEARSRDPFTALLYSKLQGKHSVSERP
jgi:hypothetical protein